MNPYLFVYGSLMNTIQSSIARFLQDNSIFIGEGYVQGYLYDLGHYPGMVADKNASGKVVGHIFQLKEPEKVLPVLDEYEAIGEQFSQYEEYVRKEVPVLLSESENVGKEKETMQCWAYLYNLPTEHLRSIPSGNYLEYLKNNESYQRFIDSV